MRILAAVSAVAGLLIICGGGSVWAESGLIEDTLPPKYAPQTLDDMREQTYFSLSKSLGQPVYSEMKIGLDSHFIIYVGKDGNRKKIKCRTINMRENLEFSAKCQQNISADGKFPRIMTSIRVGNKWKSIEFYFIHNDLEKEYNPGSNIGVSTAEFYSSWYSNRLKQIAFQERERLKDRITALEGILTEINFTLKTSVDLVKAQEAQFNDLERRLKKAMEHKSE